MTELTINGIVLKMNIIFLVALSLNRIIPEVNINFKHLILFDIIDLYPRK